MSYSMYIRKGECVECPLGTEYNGPYTDEWPFVLFRKKKNGISWKILQNYKNIYFLVKNSLYASITIIYTQIAQCAINNAIIPAAAAAVHSNAIH